jgi:hypothetical protein
MLKKKIYLILVMFISTFGMAQGFAWAKKAGGAGVDETYNVVTDIQGNIIVTGEHLSSPFICGSYTINSKGADDIFIAKYDPSGNVLWAQDIGDSGMDWISSVATDKSGNVFLAGTHGSATLTVGSYTLTGGGFNDVLVAKFDPNGNVLWAKSFGGSFDDRGYSVTTDSFGNSYITGSFSSTSMVFGTFTLTNTSFFTSNVFLLKLDPLGNVVWAKQSYGSSNDQGHTITIDASNNLYISGCFGSSSISFGSFTLVNSTVLPLFLVKYSSAGNEIWAKQLVGRFDNNSERNCILFKKPNIIYMVGTFYSATAVFGSYTLTNAGSGTGDCFISRLDTSGNTIWAKRAGSPGQETGFGLATYPSGNLLVSGGFTNNPVVFGAYTVTPKPGASDPMFIAEYDPLGNEVCASAFETGGDDMNALAIDTIGNAYIFGDYLSNPFILGNDTLTLSGGEDVFLARFSYCNMITSMEEPPIIIEPVLYPNPSSGNFFIRNQNDSKIEKIIITDVIGRIIYEIEQNMNMINIDLSSHSKGIYICRALVNGQMSVRKILIQ